MLTSISAPLIPNKFEQTCYDLVVIGGGIHGTAIACEAASRSLNTLLVHADDFGVAGSCFPSCVMGAGLQNLEDLHLSCLLANEHELAHLHAKAPHLVRQLDHYVLDAPSVRSTRRVNLGLRLYRKIIKAKARDAGMSPDLDKTFDPITFSSIPAPEYAINFMRFNIAQLQLLQGMKGHALPRHRLITATREKDVWQLRLNNENSSQSCSLTTKVLVNSAGSQSRNVVREALGISSRGGAHASHQAYLFLRMPQHWQAGAIFQADDKSLVYAHRFDHEHLCFGPFFASDNTAEAKAQTAQTALDLWNRHAKQKLSTDDIVSCSWREIPLCDDPSHCESQIYSDCLLDLNNPGKVAPLLNVYGSHLIQHRIVAEQALDILQPFTKAKANPVYKAQGIPGGDFSSISFEDALDAFEQSYPFVAPNTIERMLYLYGSNLPQVLGDAQSGSDLGQYFGHGLYEKEVNYLQKYEWAKSAEDILWRRTYLGLYFSQEEQQVLQAYMIGQEEYKPRPAVGDSWLL